MANSTVEIFNLALSACGSEGLVSNVDERSREADLCRLWYPQCRDLVMTTAPWPCLREYSRLARVAEREGDVWEAGDPSPNSRFSYALPTDFLFPLHMQSLRRFDWNGRFISSDEETPILFYSRREENVGYWDVGLYTAVYHYLAARIARPLSGSSGIVQENFEIAQMNIDNMRALAANASSTTVETLPDWISARGYSNTQETSFHYPMNSLSIETSA